MTSPSNAPDPPSSRDPYVVEVEKDGCDRCGAGKMWVVVGPDDVAMGMSFEVREDAEDVADFMNTAYEAGKKAPDHA